MVNNNILRKVRNGILALSVAGSLGYGISQMVPLSEGNYSVSCAEVNVTSRRLRFSGLLDTSEEPTKEYTAHITYPDGSESRLINAQGMSSIERLIDKSGRCE